MGDQVINVAKDFSRAPAGRFVSDGPNSGQRFRQEKLIPALKASGRIVIELDGTRGFGSSFLEEAFGGLVRAGFAPDMLSDRIEFRASDPSLGKQIRSYWHSALAA